MTEPSARVVADSVSPAGHRLTTVEATIHRFILAEVDTHRVFSRNSASSRAIPLHKQLERVREDTAVPVKFPLEQPGMSGGDEVVDRDVARDVWIDAAWEASKHAETLGKLGVHKSVANRLIEPFGWHTVVITSTAWQNFYGLRVHPAAQPEFQVVAAKIKDAISASEPQLLDHGMWHLPYVFDDDIRAVESYLYATLEEGTMTKRAVTRGLIKVSTSRVAAVSLLRQGQPREIEKDFGLYDRLSSAEPMHASPLEHVATPNPENVHTVTVASFADPAETRLLDLTLPKYGNFLGWHQHRFDVEVAKSYQAFS